MTRRPPDLHELIGDGGGSAGQDDRLERVHDMLVVAGPPPAGPVPDAPPVGGQVVPMRRRRWVELVAAAALVCIAAGAGYLLGNRSDGIETVRVVEMHGLPPVAGASAELDIGETDAAGNIPMEMRVEGLSEPPAGGWYELFVSKDGKPGASCGTFTTNGDETTVRLSVGYDLGAWRDADHFDGWVVTDAGPDKRILLTTD